MRLPCFFLQNRTNNFRRHWLRLLFVRTDEIFYTPCRAYQALGEKVTGIERPRRSAGTRNGRFLSPSKRYTHVYRMVQRKISAARLRTVYSDDTGHTPRKLPPLRSNLPLHRIRVLGILAPRALIEYQTHGAVSSFFFVK